VHDLDFSLHVVDVLLADELALCDRLDAERFLCLDVACALGRAELASAEHFADLVHRGELDEPLAEYCLHGAHVARLFCAAFV